MKVFHIEKMKNKPKVDLKKFFCTQPFLYTEFHRSGPKREQYVCCPDWNDINLYDSDNLLDNWNSEKAKQIRRGQLSGNFVGCKPEVCPALNTLVNTGKPVLSIRPIEDYNPEEYYHPSPKRIKVCSDDSCNLKCPTCRTELKPNTEFRTARTRGLLDSIEKYYAPTLEEVFTSGGGDPFYSTPMREFLEKIDKVKFPKIKNIMLHTNGILFTPKIWERMKNIHPYVKYVEISVDAAQLPELPQGEFDWRDLIGMSVVTDKGYNLGTVDDLMETGSNDVLVVKANKKDAFGQAERLIPFLTDSVIKEVKHDAREITVDWDPGF